jgi:hypothetical protein
MNDKVVHALRSIPAIMHVGPTSRFNGIVIVLNTKQAPQMSDGFVLEHGQPALKPQRRQIFAGPRIARLFLGGDLTPGQVCHEQT